MTHGIRLEAQRLRAIRSKGRDQEAVLRKRISDDLAHGDSRVLAQELRVTPQFLSDIKLGHRRITDGILDRLCGDLSGDSK